jgi:thioredoxin
VLTIPKYYYYSLPLEQKLLNFVINSVTKIFKKIEKMAEHLTKEKFIERIFDYENETEWKYKGESPVFIDFYADWCGPCKMIAPVVEELSKEYEGLIDIYKVDTEDQQELASIFGIRSIPSLLFIPLSGQPQMMTGAVPKDGLIQIFEDVFKIKK